MRPTLRLDFLCLAALATVVAAGSPAPAAEPVSAPRLYAADCGAIDFADLGFFSDTGDYDGKPGKIVVPCFIVRHPKGTLVWDTGLGDALVGKPAERQPNGLLITVTTKLVDQMKAIGLEPSDVTHVAFSHLHLDHTGNANLFTSATWILNRAELAASTVVPAAFAVSPPTFSAYAGAKQQLIDGDYDVFGDGTVRIVRTPGHTPGHQALLLKLRKSGFLILSGDLYHLRDDVKLHAVPIFNVNRADTLASMERVERLAAKFKARLIVQHDPGDFASLPEFPAYLD